MPSCPACGAPVTAAVTQDGTNVPLETYTETTGRRRYVVVALGPPVVVQAASESFTGGAYPDHRRDCPNGDDR